MHVIVFGATGSVGRLTVLTLLEEEHTVTAFARAPHKLEMKNPNLRLFAGDALSALEVSKALLGHDAVVVTLGGGCRERASSGLKAR